MDTELTNIVAQAELALLEERELMHTGPRFRVLHRFHKIGTDCQAGEEVVAVLLLNKAQEIPLPLSLSLRLVFNYLAEWRRVPQTATQIAAGIQAYAF